VRFDTLKFNWLGSLDRVDGMCISWNTSPIKTWADMLTKEMTVGSSGAGSQMETYPAILNKLFGTKIKVIAGYKDGVAVYIAMERGELDGRCGGQLTVIKSTRPHWLTERKIQVPILIAQKRSPEFPDTPTVLEFVKDEPTRQQLDLVMLTQGLDRPVMLPPGVPCGSCGRPSTPPWRIQRFARISTAGACMSIRSAGRRWPKRSSAPLRCRRKSLPALVK
jgi:hypothetical protein